MFRLALLALAAVSTQAFLFGDSAKWDDLRVTWGANPWSSEYFVQMPRTVADAAKAGWKKIGDCDTSAKWRGARYIKGDDYAVVLLFDIQGTIAGIQTAIPTDTKNVYPSKNIMPPFVKYDDGKNVVTAYFVEPSTICSTGRSASDMQSAGTGSALYLQMSENPEESVAAPATPEAALQASDKWSEGKCFWSMGKHFWGKMSADMNCDDFLPIFLLYNGGKLNAFGWALGTGLKSPRYEHPAHDKIHLFMNNPPKCLLDEARPLSTMHIYFTGHPVLNNHC